MEKNDVYTEAVDFATNLELKKTSTNDILTYVFAHVKAKINELSGWTIVIDPAYTKPYYVKGETTQWELPKEVSDAIDLVFFQYPDAMLKKINYICSYNECNPFITYNPGSNPKTIDDLTFVNTTSGIPIPQEPMKGKVQIFMKLIETQLESLLTTFSKNTEVTDVNLINIIKKYDTTIVKPITFEKALIIFFTNYTTIKKSSDETTSFATLIFGSFIRVILTIYNRLTKIYSFMKSYFDNLSKSERIGLTYIPTKGKLNPFQGGRKKRYLKNKSINNKNIYKRSKKNKHTRKSK